MMLGFKLRMTVGKNVTRLTPLRRKESVMNTEDVVAKGIVISVVALAIYVVVAVCVMVPAENYCIERGWAGASVTFSFKKFCTARIDQTDIIVPIEKAENRIHEPSHEN